MSQNLLYISFKKIFNKKSKAFLLIVPIALIICLAIPISSQINNISNAISNGVFATLQTQNSVLQIKKNIQVDANDPRSFFNVNTNFTEADVSVAKAIPNVENVSVNYTIPIKPAITKDLFNNISLTLGDISVIDSDSAKIYTDQNFVYQEGAEIPIILNAKSFVETYEDWGGQTEISVTRPTQRQAGAQQPGGLQIGATKQRNITYNKADLIGKTFEISFGGLDALPTYKIVRDETTRTMKFVKYTDEELAANEQARKDAISKYYDYTKISTPVTYKFKIVGVIENDATSQIYVPTNFASIVTTAVVNNERSARTNTIPTDELNQILQGMTYDGETLSTGRSLQGRGNNFVGQNQGQTRPTTTGTQTPTTATNVFVQRYSIPGLIIETNSSDGSVIGIYAGDDYWTNSLKSSDTITLKISDLSARNQVIQDLNKDGFSYIDVSKSDIITNLESTLKAASNILLISFIALLIAIVIFTMYKYVADSRKEIGIFRAIGMKASTVLIMISLQSLISLFIAVILGTILGILLNLGLANIIHSWFDSSIVAQMKSIYGISASVPINTFMQIDTAAIMKYLGITLVVSIIIGLIPAYKASKVKPIEAIKD